MKEERIFQPKYMERFRCIGSDCEDTCCSGWQITMDEPAYRLYEAHSHVEGLPRVGVHVKELESPNHRYYAEIVLDGKSQCPMLSGERLCTVHLKYGADYLFNLCMSFPRVIHEVHGSYQRAAALSCPEAARLALLAPDTMEFVEAKEPLNPLRWDVRSISADPAKPRHRYYPELQRWVLECVRDRSRPLEDRLWRIGKLCVGLENLYESGKGGDIPILLEDFHRCEEFMGWTFRASPTSSTSPASLAASEFDGRVTAAPPSALSDRDRLTLLRACIDKRLFSGLVHKPYMHTLLECLNGLRYTSEEVSEETLLAYRTGFQNRFLPFMESHPYIMENLLANTMLLSAFPSQRRPYEEFASIAIIYALLSLHLIGLMNNHQESFTMRHFIRLVSDFSRTYVHAPAYLQESRKRLEEQGVGGLSGLFFLCFPEKKEVSLSNRAGK